MYLIVFNGIHICLELTLHFLLIAGRMLGPLAEQRHLTIRKVIDSLFDILSLGVIKGVSFKTIKILLAVILFFVNRFFLLFHKIKNLNQQVADCIRMHELVICTYEIGFELVVLSKIAPGL